MILCPVCAITPPYVERAGGVESHCGCGAFSVLGYESGVFIPTQWRFRFKEHALIWNTPARSMTGQESWLEYVGIGHSFHGNRARAMSFLDDVLLRVRDHVNDRDCLAVLGS